MRFSFIRCKPPRVATNVILCLYTRECPLREAKSTFATFGSENESTCLRNPTVEVILRKDAQSRTRATSSTLRPLFPNNASETTRTFETTRGAQNTPDSCCRIASSRVDCCKETRNSCLTIQTHIPACNTRFGDPHPRDFPRQLSCAHPTNRRLWMCTYCPSNFREFDRISTMPCWHFGSRDNISADTKCRPTDPTTRTVDVWDSCPWSNDKSDKCRRSYPRYPRECTKMCRLKSFSVRNTTCNTYYTPQTRERPFLTMSVVRIFSGNISTSRAIHIDRWPKWSKSWSNRDT
jgi:hypothetical protein